MVVLTLLFINEKACQIVNRTRQREKMHDKREPIKEKDNGRAENQKE